MPLGYLQAGKDVLESCWSRFEAEKPVHQARFDPLQMPAWRGLRCLLGVDLSRVNLWGSRLTSSASHLFWRRAGLGGHIFRGHNGTGGDKMAKLENDLLSLNSQVSPSCHAIETENISHQSLQTSSPCLEEDACSPGRQRHANSTSSPNRRANERGGGV